MLSTGVRHFDTRIGWDNNQLVLVHSSDAVALDHGPLTLVRGGSRNPIPIISLIAIIFTAA